MIDLMKSFFPHKPTRTWYSLIFVNCSPYVSYTVMRHLVGHDFEDADRGAIYLGDILPSFLLISNGKQKVMIGDLSWPFNGYQNLDKVTQEFDLFANFLDPVMFREEIEKIESIASDNYRFFDARELLVASRSAELVQEEKQRIVDSKMSELIKAIRQEFKDRVGVDLSGEWERLIEIPSDFPYFQYLKNLESVNFYPRPLSLSLREHLGDIGNIMTFD